MVQKFKNEEILEYLMTSDFNEELTNKELKALLVKFREFYRYMYGAKDNKIIDKDFQIKKLEEKLKVTEKNIIDLVNKNTELEQEKIKLKKRKLTLLERIKGKIDI